MANAKLASKADAYAQKVADWHIMEKKIWYNCAFNGFMAGALSRNAEIKELKAQIAKLKNLLKEIDHE
jgi:ketopantoate reductase